MLFGKNLVSIDDISLQNLNLIFTRTEEMKKLVKEKGGDSRLKGKILAALFFEPSTRTFSSFISAMQRLGGGIIPLNGMTNTSIEKGESFEHTVKVFSTYADCLVIRHPQVGLPKKSCLYSTVPVINAGDGIGEHPSQAIYDTYTIFKHFPHKKELIVSLVGDLKNGRTVHSLAKLLAKTNRKIHFNFISPKILKMPEEIKRNVALYHHKIDETDKLSEKVGMSDVLYVTRVQKERFTKLIEYEMVKSYYQVDSQILKNAKKELIIMHPLPIAAGEINTELDTDPRSIYLTSQLQNGLYVRMALLDLILRKESNG
ncbi:aspartate carbamoyltransferase [Candidatus Gottesmanbacteria bacterium RIFCSPHIGHO2_02_FULL_39_14]|uniref:Aspartate carbamoyltransferase n=2 Tax=Candidatus Gottesmaniibacteriota TaxID=1752720 RepID=A0A1F6A3D0_9BACT|nr:MAG: aspartate carbamoyltransferase [Candidatus Gottesmanbacteria bacterium RIFCSPHIGHO2_02_FULL_39_14]OGG31634.1 MAG: aspartate carbamoyltransferase [Candidatus Gottesmanbacteria bacterium RIFCSPLOWO2_02_FULL_38_8]